MNIQKLTKPVLQQIIDYLSLNDIVNLCEIYQMYIPFLRMINKIIVQYKLFCITMPLREELLTPLNNYIDLHLFRKLIRFACPHTVTDFMFKYHARDMRYLLVMGGYFARRKKTMSLKYWYKSFMINSEINSYNMIKIVKLIRKIGMETLSERYYITTTLLCPRMEVLIPAFKMFEKKTKSFTRMNIGMLRIHLLNHPHREWIIEKYANFTKK